MKRAALSLYAAILIISGCTEDSPLAPDADQIVVRGYIYAGEPVNDIQITSTLSLGSEDEKAPPVNNAAVSLHKNGTAYALVASAGDSGYYHYEGTDLSVESGDLFEIRVEADGDVTTASTAVPFPPVDVSTSSEILVIPTTFDRGMGFDDSTRFVTITWNEEVSSLFYVVVENIEQNPVEIETFGAMEGGEMKRRFVFPPTNNNEFRIQRFSVSYYGEHVVKVYRVNQEYADLYDSRNQDSRDLNEPLTNIKNGLGVFSAFASASVLFDVVSE